MEMVVSVVMTLLYGVMDGENKTIRSLLPMEYMSKMWKKVALCFIDGVSVSDFGAESISARFEGPRYL